jgi:hypothetical protein
VTAESQRPVASWRPRRQCVHEELQRVQSHDACDLFVE